MTHVKYLRVRGEERHPHHQRQPQQGNTSACAEKSLGQPTIHRRHRKYLRVRGEETTPLCSRLIELEIPPRARRRVAHRPPPLPACGNTSACAEKRAAGPSTPGACRKYLRVRGEERLDDEQPRPYKEIPPRARRRENRDAPFGGDHGNTSACAEKRLVPFCPRSWWWKYLRVRGEEWSHSHRTWAATEIPPRARRRVIYSLRMVTRHGNTSACAEKSRRCRWGTGGRRKYLRVRGEEHAATSWRVIHSEIPPRARRRAATDDTPPRLIGNTSACAEKRRGTPRWASRRWKYLRVRGEEPTMSETKCHELGIPPRARRRVVPYLHPTKPNGNTSACAEKRWCGTPHAGQYWKYLRVRGEEAMPRCSTWLASEIPPRARRREDTLLAEVVDDGNTSACAEKRHRAVRRACRTGKYLRVRGEEWCATTLGRRRSEIPPRARRRGPVIAIATGEQGNTSACAEKRR